MPLWSSLVSLHSGLQDEEDGQDMPDVYVILQYGQLATKPAHLQFSKRYGLATATSEKKAINE